MPIGNFGWQDTPSIATPLDATNLEAFGAFIGAYADTAHANLFSSSDVLSRTSVLAPSTLATVSVMDAPWSVKGDTRVATDGIIVGGILNQVSSAALAMTTADVGKTVVVLNVGPNVLPGGVGPSVPGVFVTTISSVASGVATLAGSATIPGTGLTVKVGTDDSTAIAAAILAASNRAAAQGGSTGAVKLVFPSGRHFLFSFVSPQNNVILDFTGATLHCAATNSAASNNSMMFRPGTNVSVSNFHLRGGTWVGTGTENGGSGSQGIIYWSNAGFGQNGTATYTDISVREATVTNWATGVWDLRGASRIRFDGNTCRNTSTYAGTNTINIIMGGGGSPVNSSDVFIQNNYLDGQGAEGIAIGEAAATTGGFNRAIITGNIVRSIGGFFAGSFQGATPIDIEWSTVTTGQGREVIVSNNVVEQAATPGGGSSYSLSVTQTSMPANAHVTQHVMVSNNICVSKDGGINCTADDAIVANNIIDYASVAGGVLTGLKVGSATTLSITADTQASTTPLVLANVVVNGGGIAENGMILTGSGIPSGTSLVSGAGTPNWTISLAATTTAAGNALTGWIAVKRNQIIDNVLHTTATYTKNSISASGLADSRVAGNIVYIEPGNTTTAFAGAAVYMQRSYRNDIESNRVYNAGSYGILVTEVYGVNVERNRVYNSNQSNQAGQNGITVSNASGGPFFIRDNYCWDDQAVHTMVRAVDLGGAGGRAMLIGNDSRGATDASPFGVLVNYLLVRGNTGDTTTIPAATSAITLTGSVFTTAAVNYPSMIAVQGGTVTLIQHSRTGSSTRNISSTTNVTVYLMPGDTISITYSVAPTVNLFPLQ